MAVEVRRREREEKAGASNQGHTYGGSPFCLRKTQITTWQRPWCRILSIPFPQAPSWLPVGIPVVGRDELTQPFNPELISFIFREVGVLDQKRLVVSGDGTGEQFVIQIDSHGAMGSSQWPGSNCLSAIKWMEKGGLYSANS